MNTTRSLRVFAGLTAIGLFVAVLPVNSQQTPPPQGMGAQAVLRSSEQLQLTSRQRSQISAILQKTAAEFNRLSRAQRGQSGLAERLEALRQDAQEDALALLNDDQRKVWDNLKAPGSSVSGTQRKGSAAQNEEVVARSLIIPSIEEMKNPPARGAFGPNAEITRTASHPASGSRYVILTDYRDAVAVAALERLAEHRDGKILTVASLGTLHESAQACVEIRDQLRELKPGCLAIAPRIDSYRENLHLCMLKILCSLDDDPQLDAFPGYLMARDSHGLAELIDRTIAFQPIAKSDLAPVSIGAIEDVDARRYRSYQKAKVMQRMFAEAGKDSPAIIITTRESHTRRDDFPDLQAGSGDIAMLPGSERHTFDRLSPAAVSALDDNNLLYMFGHGTTERICGTKTSAFADIDFTDELVFCGSCMSATPLQSDRQPANSDSQASRFASYAMDNGAVMLLGHMGLCGGFPKVYPMSELVLDGLSAGESYQRLMNALIGAKPIPDYYSQSSTAPQPGPADPANGLLYVLWGDPALVPITD